MEKEELRKRNESWDLAVDADCWWRAIVWCWSPHRYSAYSNRYPFACIFILFLGMSLCNGLKGCLSKRYICPEPVSVTGFLLGKGIFADITEALWRRSFWMNWVDPKFNETSLYKKGENTQRSHRKTEAEIAVMPLQTKECQESPAATRI